MSFSGSFRRVSFPGSDSVDVAREVNDALLFNEMYASSKICASNRLSDGRADDAAMLSI